MKPETIQQEDNYRQYYNELQRNRQEKTQIEAKAMAVSQKELINAAYRNRSIATTVWAFLVALSFFCSLFFYYKEHKKIFRPVESHI